MPNQEPTAPVGARETIAEWYRAGSNISPDDALLAADDLLASLRAANLVIVSRKDVEQALDAMGYVEGTYFWDKWGYEPTYIRLRAALGGE